MRSTFLLLLMAGSLAANEAVDRAHRFEDAGDSTAAREAYLSALRATPNDADLNSGYAEMLERFRDPNARAQYRKSAGLLKTAGKTPEAAQAARRAVLLDLVAGDRTAAAADLNVYRSLGGSDLKLAAATPATATTSVVQIPGPIRSFARMSALSPDVQPDDVLAALGRNVITNGYQASHSNDALEPTEFLKLVHRYLSQARELEKLAGADKVIKIQNCESTQTNDLLRTLGYRMRGACGSELVLETVNAQRAFITRDSGFPLAELESALRTDKPFSYDYQPSRVTVLYTPDYWLSAREKQQGDFIDAFLDDPGLCRFYLGMSKLDPETANGLKNAISAARLRTFASVLDFFGGNFEIRQGRAVVPGGTRSEQAWGELAGASAEKGPEFFEKLMIKDDGWLASLYDALARIYGPVQEYLTDPARMKRFYTAVRGRVTTPGPARPVFRSNAEMMLFTTRLHVDSAGRVHVPGGIDVWKELFEKSPRGKYDAKLSRAAANWKDADDVVEALFALCRKSVDNEPLKLFMALSDIDRNREQPLQPATVQRLIRDWQNYGAQYSVFADAPLLTDKTLLSWLDTAQMVDHGRDPLFRQDSIGTYQALTGIWQIFCRQGSIPAAKADEALAQMIMPFATVKNSRELFDAGRSGITALVRSSGVQIGPKEAGLQEKVLGLLAGGTKLDDSDVRAELVQQEQHIFEAQKLLALDLLFELADNLQAVSKGEKLNAQLSARLAARVADIQLPRASMTGAEKNAMAFGYYVDRHIDEERKVNLRAVIDKAAKDPEKLKDIRGQLAPSLRDTLVGFNYVHYAPPGAQILITNPLFVRGHDFLGMTGSSHSWKTTEMYGTGWPANAGGRLVGSLAGLPYALAEAEQNFLVPTQTQALIWGDLVPQMMLAARSRRFWAVTPVQVHWVGLHMRATEALLADASLDPAHRDALSKSLFRVASPARAATVMSLVSSGDVRDALEALTPSEMYAVASELATNNDKPAGPVTAEIAHLRQLDSDQVSDAAISGAWGTPKPTLANSYRPELLNLRTFPTLMGYSSRIMAESWESNMLYWADVSDQMGLAPAQLNLLVPEWTQKVVERIFASHLEDWPALLRSVRSVGDEVRKDNAQLAVAAVRAGN